MTSQEDQAALRASALYALRANSMSPIAALDPFIRSIADAGGMGGALIGWNGATREIDSLCAAYLRSVLQSVSNEQIAVQPQRLAPVRQKVQHVAKEPSTERRQAAASVMRATYPAIFSQILIGGRDIGRITCGEAKTIVRFNMKAIGEKTRENFILEGVLAYGKPPADTLDIRDFIPEKALKKINDEWERKNAA